MIQERAEKEQSENDKIIAYLIASALILIVMILAIFMFKLRRLNNDLQKSEHDLSSRNQLLREQISNNDKLLTIIAHDVRGPIASLKELLGVALQTPNSDDNEQLLQLSKELADTTFILVEELLEWARMDKGLEKFERESVEVKPFIESLLSLYQV